MSFRTGTAPRYHTGPQAPPRRGRSARRQPRVRWSMSLDTALDLTKVRECAAEAGLREIAFSKIARVVSFAADDAAVRINVYWTTGEGPRHARPAHASVSRSGRWASRHAAPLTLLSARAPSASHGGAVPSQRSRPRGGGQGAQRRRRVTWAAVFPQRDDGAAPGDHGRPGAAERRRKEPPRCADGERSAEPRALPQRRMLTPGDESARGCPRPNNGRAQSAVAGILVLFFQTIQPTTCADSARWVSPRCIECGNASSRSDILLPRQRYVVSGWVRGKEGPLSYGRTRNVQRCSSRQ